MEVSIGECFGAELAHLDDDEDGEDPVDNLDDIEGPVVGERVSKG